MIDTFVDVRVRIANFRELAHHVAALPEPFRPIHFSRGERVRDKDASRIDDSGRFAAFVDQQVSRVSGFDLVGQRIRFTFFGGETRTANHESTHIGCSVTLRGRQWSLADFTLLLKLLCSAPGTERADACRRAEWEHRHLYVKMLPPISIQTTLGVDMSASLPGLYWWTVFSDALAKRHDLDIGELTRFAAHHEWWATDDGGRLYAFRLYPSPDDWEREEARISEFLERHSNFFSLTRIAERVENTQTKEEFDQFVRRYRAGALPWERRVPESL